MNLNDLLSRFAFSEASASARGPAPAAAKVQDDSK
jgi:hypothetical protein